MIEHARLLELLHYDPTTGVFTWRVDRRLGANGKGALRAAAGDVAGGLDVDSGYWQIRIGRRLYRGHRLAWFYMTGQWPECQVDHRDTDRSNNRWLNLRDVPQPVNAQNLRRARIDSKTGLQGVQYHRKKAKFAARITMAGKKRVLGYFDDPNVAHQVYLKAKRQLHEGCTI